MLCDPCVSACALLGFALKAPILGTGLANLKTTILTRRYRNCIHSLFGMFWQITKLLLKSSLPCCFSQWGLLFMTLQNQSKWLFSDWTLFDSHRAVNDTVCTKSVQYRCYWHQCEKMYTEIAYIFCKTSFIFHRTYLYHLLSVFIWKPMYVKILL